MKKQNQETCQSEHHVTIVRSRKRKVLSWKRKLGLELFYLRYTCLRPYRTFIQSSMKGIFFKYTTVLWQKEVWRPYFSDLCPLMRLQCASVSGTIETRNMKKLAHDQCTSLQMKDFIELTRFSWYLLFTVF